VPRTWGGALDALDVRSLSLVRETLAYTSGLAEFAFAMQGLGSGPISLFGSEALKTRYLPGVASGESIAAFAISEAGAGSDLSAMKTTARSDGTDIVIDGEKTWISNAGIAGFYVVFCRWPEGGDRSFIALVVEGGTPGCEVTRMIDVIAPHPLGTLTLTNCRVPAEAVIGEPGKGLRVALGTLDVFRTSVGAAALGFARRALDEAVTHVKRRMVFGKALGDHQMTQARIADMALAIDAAALLVYRAAWARDRGPDRINREAAMAKLAASETAVRATDRGMRVLGAYGLVEASPMERLFRDTRLGPFSPISNEMVKNFMAERLGLPRSY
jgi:alkylation response protein AidB-like acyl-CoA dehydrogenase